MRFAVLDLDAHTYVAHTTHTGERDWAETNCYVDVWIELLHALGHEPLAGLGFTLGIDLEADQWTFFKFPHHELRALFGIGVIELNPWHGVLEQTVAEVASGHPVLIEVDAWFLPDTAGTTYRTAHVKTTIAVVDIDPASRRLGYFHNQSLHVLENDDFSGVFRLADQWTAAHLPPYIEVAKPGRYDTPRPCDLAQVAVKLLRDSVRTAPSSNPFRRYAARFDHELEALRTDGGASFHGYSFAGFRQFGAAFSLAAAHLDWLRSVATDNLIANLDTAQLKPAGDAFRAISSAGKALQFRTARAAIGGKPLDATTQLAALTDAWDDGMGSLRELLH